MQPSLSKNALLLGISIAAIVGITYGLRSSQGIATPARYQVGWYDQAPERELISQIDHEFDRDWETHSVTPTRRANDFALARRLSLGLTGTVPSLEEIRELEKQPAEERLNWWVSHLLSDRRCSDYLAERLARAYVGVEDGPFVIFRRRRFVSWLSDQLEANRPYHELVSTLLTDEGLWTDSPAVNFVTVTTDETTQHPDPIRLAARTSRAFLGLRIDCLQCHDDFIGTMDLGDPSSPVGGTQRDFHQLAAFFSHTQNSLGGIQDQTRATPYRYTFLDETNEETVLPSVPFGDGWLSQDPQFTLRERLSQWVTHQDNRAFARAFVNRMWAHLCGKPLVAPIDNIPLFGPYPPGLELLATDFIESDFDVHRLIRVIAGTKAFSRDSQTDLFDITKEHEDHWAAFPLTRLRPEQMAGSIIQATSLTTIDATAHILVRLARFGQEGDFVRRYGDAGEDEFDSRGGTVAQRLLLMNGDMLNDRNESELTAPRHLSDLAPNPTSAVRTAYMTTLTREPSESELRYFVDLLQDQPTEITIERIQDLFWVLLNSNEFTWNH